jgi:PPOX class probable F420-dependent enzyme
VYEMSREQVRAFLQESTRTLKVATIRPDGSPHVVPVWFVLDGEDIVFTTSSASIKARNLRARPAVSLCVDDDQPPYGFVTVFGTAAVEERPADLLMWTTRIAGRYLGAARAEEAGQRYAAIDDMLVRVTVTSPVALGGIAD